MRWLLLLACAAPLFGADTDCTNGAVAGLTNVSVTACKVIYDTQNPSGEQFAGTTKSRVISGIFYPTDKGVTNATCPIVIYGPGKGWNGFNQIPAYRVTNFGNAATLQKYINDGMCVWTAYDSLAATLTAVTWNVGTSVIHATRTLNNGQYWPNEPKCLTPANCGFAYPYSIVVDGNGAHPESATVNSLSNDSGSGAAETFDLNVTEVAAFQHTGVSADVPRTQWPVELNDRMSLLSWIKTNAGQGTYPGNPLDIRYWPTSSDAHIQLMSMFMTGHLTSCATAGWYASYGFGPTCASDNTATGWKFGPGVAISPPLDLVWMYQNTWGAVTSTTNIRALLGVPPDGTVTGGNAYATAASPIGVATYGGFPPVALQVGTADGVTPICTVSQTWPTCPGNQFAGFQAAYNSTGQNYQVFVGLGHGLDATAVPSQELKITSTGAGGAAGASTAGGQD